MNFFLLLTFVLPLISFKALQVFFRDVANVAAFFGSLTTFSLAFEVLIETSYLGGY